MNKLLRVVAMTLLAAPFLPAAELHRWTGDPALGAAELEKQWVLVADAQRSTPIRGLLRFALEATGLGWHPERVEAALARARSMQDLDPASKTFGNFKWRSDQPRPLDLNAVEFASQLMGFMRGPLNGKLSPAARGQLDQLMTDAIAGLRSHVVKIEYTNIFVMKAWDLIAIGEALGRADVAADGYQRFDDWLRFTAKNGIGEYGGVTYYGVDFDSLALIAKFAGRVEGRKNAERAMQFLWTDVAANWWAPGDRLGGTNSRSYDYLFGRGYLEAHTWTAGWLREKPLLEQAGWMSGDRDNLVTLREATTWPPPATWTEKIRGELPRTVVQRWGAQPEQVMVHWVGRHVSLASSGASHGNDERTLVANLGDSPAVPQLTLFMDGRGDPFGTKKTENAAGQAKSLHLTPFIATAQRGSEVLQVLSDEPLGPKSKHKPGELSCFLTQLTLPAAAEVWFDNERVQPGPPEDPRLLPKSAAVFVRMGDAALAMRVLIATTTGGARAPVQFIEDKNGGVARRLTVVHSAGEPSGRGTMAVWVRAADGLDDAEFVAWRKKFLTTRWNAEVTDNGEFFSGEVAGEQGSLRIEANLAKGERRVMVGGEPSALLSVNGRDVGREVMQEFLSR